MFEHDILCFDAVMVKEGKVIASCQEVGSNAAVYVIVVDRKSSLVRIEGRLAAERKKLVKYFGPSKKMYLLDAVLSTGLSP